LNAGGRTIAGAVRPDVPTINMAAMMQATLASAITATDI